MPQPTPSQEIERFLCTGQHDMFGAAWPGKTVTETFATPVALHKAQQEVAEFHRFRELSRNLVEVNEEICRVRPVEDILTPQEKKRRKRSSRKSPGK